MYLGLKNVLGLLIFHWLTGVASTWPIRFKSWTFVTVRERVIPHDHDQRKSLRAIPRSVTYSSSRKASLKCKTAPYKFWNWEFAPSASVVLARWLKLLLFQLYNGTFLSYIKKLLSRSYVFCRLLKFELRFLTRVTLRRGYCWEGVMSKYSVPIFFIDNKTGN